MGFKATMMRVGVSGILGGVLGACAVQQDPARVVNGYGNVVPSSSQGMALGPVAKAQGSVQVSNTGTPPVLLDPPGKKAQVMPVQNAMQEEALAKISPAAGPDMGAKIATQQTMPVASAKAVTAQPEPTVVAYTVLPSDTAYKIARKYNTTIDRLLKDNGLKSMTEVKEGQTLQVTQNSKPTTSAWDDMKRMLSDATADTPIRPTQTQAQASAQKTEPQVAQADLPKAIADIEPAAGESPKLDNRVMPDMVSAVKAPVNDVQYVQHTVESKETIYRISVNYHVSVLDIMAANDFDQPQELKANTVIKVPVKQAFAQADLKRDAEIAPAAGEPVQVAMLTKPAAQDVMQTDASPAMEAKAVQAPVVSTIKEGKLDPKIAEQKRGQIDQEAANAKGFVWPVKGQIVSRFGDDGHGVAKTGINIAVPQGTSVLASEGGTVLYADEGLKIYGKLVLIRHDDGMVSAYAHNGYLLVKKNERVKKGQVIALSGATGNVDCPQVHFELRQHASAIDPIAMLPRL
jgi:murein DD-endopeptidase MepM/ murein hydrolase activator NlpD